MLPSAYGLGQYFQDLGHSFSPYGPPSRQITYIDGALEIILKMNLNFWKNIFRPQYIDLVRGVQSCSVYRFDATSAKHFSVANTSMDSLLNVTLNLARRSNTILFLRESIGTDISNN